MVLQAVQLEGAWTTLENLEGFLSRVTLQQGDLEHFAARGKKYYSQWRGIRDTFNNGVKNNDAALKQKARTDFQQLASSVEFQDFFSDVRQQLAHTQKVHLIASLVVMVAITVVSMGAGTIVSGALGGTRVAIVAATAGEAATATQVVATGLGVSRTVASVAGFVTEAAVFTGLSTAVFEKDPSIGGVITSFGKNLVLFGGMRGLARVFESLGLLGNAAKLGADASKGTKVLTHTADALAETVLMGGVGVLLTAVEAEVKAKLNGRPVTSDEYEQMLISTLLQTIAMVIVARAGAPMLAKLQSSAALGSTRLRIKAHTEQTLAHAQHVQGLRDSGKLTAETVTAAATRDRILIEEELALAQEVLQSAKHDPAAVDAALQKAGLSRAELQHHVDSMTAQLPTLRGMEVMFRLRELGPGELGCPRAHVKDVLAAQRALSGEAPVLEATNPATGARTWRCARAKPAQTSATSAANVDTTPVRITELMPTWALDATGQRLVHAAEASGLGETIFGLSEPAISALRDADAALLRGDDAAAAAAFERSGIAAKSVHELGAAVRDLIPPSAKVETRPLSEQSNLANIGATAETLATRAAEITHDVTMQKVIHDVELTGIESAVQVEIGLRILDPLFGARASAAIKDAVKRRISGSEALIKASHERMPQMLSTLRDPALTIESRRAALHSALGQYENLVLSTAGIDHSAFRFDEARQQINATLESTFSKMLAVNETGILTRNGLKVGTLPELLTSVKSVNALYSAKQIAKEYVVTISTPSTVGVGREVKLLSRVPKQPTTASKTDVSPSDNSPGAEGTVVDIGVGLGSFARDAAQELGPLVQTEYGPKYADPAMIRRDLTWEHTGTRTDAESVLVLGDSLQTLEMTFAPTSVKRLFINNINAHYAEGGQEYTNLALGLRKIMKDGGTVEVQWSTETETTNGKTGSRGHITGNALQHAFERTVSASTRTVSVDTATKPTTDYDYSIEATRNKTGEAGKTPPTNPIPEFRWVFTFGKTI